MPVSCPAGERLGLPLCLAGEAAGISSQARSLADPKGEPTLSSLSSSSAGRAGGAKAACCALQGGKPATRVRPHAAFLLLPAMVLVRTADQGALPRCSFGSGDPKFKPSVKQTLPVPLLISFALAGASIIVVFLFPSPSF